jgi:hypothetical protein
MDCAVLPRPICREQQQGQLLCTCRLAQGLQHTALGPVQPPLPHSNKSSNTSSHYHCGSLW